MAVKLVIRGMNKLRSDMRAKEKKLSDLKPEHKRAGQAILKWVDKNFVAEGGLHERTSLRWQQLSDSRIAQRKKLSPRGKIRILQWRGRLRGRWVVTAFKKSARVKSQTPYAADHEHGHGRLPRRQMLPRADQGRRIVHPIIDAHVKRSIK